MFSHHLLSDKHLSEIFLQIQGCGCRIPSHTAYLILQVLFVFEEQHFPISKPGLLLEDMMLFFSFLLPSLHTLFCIYVQYPLIAFFRNIKKYHQEKRKLIFQKNKDYLCNLSDKYPAAAH